MVVVILSRIQMSIGGLAAVLSVIFIGHVSSQKDGCTIDAHLSDKITNPDIQNVPATVAVATNNNSVLENVMSLAFSKTYPHT